MRTWITGIAGIGLAVAACGLAAWAQDRQPQPPEQGMRQRGPGEQGPGASVRRGLPPDLLIIWALDVNSDGDISAEEIANAPAALKRLDKNGDGKIGRDELRLPLPAGEQRGREGGPEGDRRPPRGPGQGEGPGPDDGNRPPRPEDR